MSQAYFLCIETLTLTLINLIQIMVDWLVAWNKKIHSDYSIADKQESTLL